MLQNFKVSRQNMRRFGLLPPATRTGNRLKSLKNFIGYITYKIINFPYKNLPDAKTSNENKLHLSLLIV
jgi:hypothetical protein|uniref:Uncharacterized protein n=1 Tax=Populus trichocarpa TaxID=3694 RepID=A0A2K2BAP5_POPTR